MSSPAARIVGLSVCMLIGLLVECSAAFISNNLVFDSSVLTSISGGRLIALAIGFLVLFRLFDLLVVLERRHQAESVLRLDALQSRIRPHFLFNSLNTISELAATQPDQAESAIEALAMLFRANLETDKSQHSLQRELDLCERYVNLERWRLGDRLSYKMSISVAVPANYLIPKLLIQPLIENAITHGVSAKGSVKLIVDVRETDTDISIKVDNKKGVEQAISRGNGIAIDNIKERLIVLYDDQHTFRVKDNDNRYSVLMRLPKHSLDISRRFA